MTDIDISLKGWYLMLGACTMVGRGAWLAKNTPGAETLDAARPDALSPVYDLQVMLQSGPNGQTSVRHVAAPPLYLESIRSLPVPAEAVCVPLGDLDRGDREAVHRAILQAEATVKALRTAKAGLVLVRSP